MKTTAVVSWTVGDLAELTAQAVQIAEQNLQQYCEHCGVVVTTEQYCDGCVTDIINWLLWDDYTQQEQWFFELDMLCYNETDKVGKGLY